MKDELIMYDEKKWDFGKFVEMIKWNSAIGKSLRSAKYLWEVKIRADNPQLTFIDEWLEIKANGYFYKINVCKNSQLANEMQLMFVLLCEEKIQGLICKEEM